MKDYYIIQYVRYERNLETKIFKGKTSGLTVFKCVQNNFLLILIILAFIYISPVTGPIEQQKYVCMCKSYYLCITSLNWLMSAHRK